MIIIMIITILASKRFKMQQCILKGKKVSVINYQGMQKAKYFVKN